MASTPRRIIRNDEEVGALHSIPDDRGGPFVIVERQYTVKPARCGVCDIVASPNVHGDRVLVNRLRERASLRREFDVESEVAADLRFLVAEVPLALPVPDEQGVV